MKVSRLQRILQMVTILQSGRYYSASELAARLGITRRTVFRDLQTLHLAGIPYYHDEKKGGYKMDSSFFLPPLNLELSEAMALLLVTCQYGTEQALPLQQGAHDAALKIESLLPGHVQQHCGSVLKSTSVRFSPRAKHEGLNEIFTGLQSAIKNCRKVTIAYDSFHADEGLLETVLSPYQLHFARRAWYVIGHSSCHEEVRTFKIGRIKRMEVLRQRYVLDEPFSIDDYLGAAWSIMPEGKIYRVKLRFSTMVARNVAEVLWHPRQKLSWENAGTLLYEVAVDGLNEIAWWVMGYGDQVEVLTPMQLRRRLADVAGNIVSMYKKK